MNKESPANHVHLFLDDRHLNIVQGVKRSIHPAHLVVRSLYVDPAKDDVSLAWGYPFVFHDAAHNREVMLYQGWSINKAKIAHTLALAASSHDGRHFVPMSAKDIGLSEQPILPNQVLPYRLGRYLFAEGQFFHLPQLEGADKYIALCLYRDEQSMFKAIIFSSNDGLHYSRIKGALWHHGSDAPDFPLSVNYSEAANRFYVYRRPRHTDRRISVSSTRDFRRFSKTTLLLQSDALDKPLTDFYGMTAFDYHDYLLGFLMTYETPNYLIDENGKRASGLAGHKFYGGKVMPQLVIGLDDTHFLRSMRNPLVAASKKYHCVYPTQVAMEDDGIHAYASLTSEAHGYTNPGKGAIGKFKWRKDGFVSLRFPKEGGFITTKQCRYHGGPLTINADAAKGKISVQIADYDNVPFEGFSYDDCGEIVSDYVKHVLRYAQHKIDELAGRIIVLSIKGKDTHLYSITGNLEWLTPYQVMKATNK